MWGLKPSPPKEKTYCQAAASPKPFGKRLLASTGILDIIGGMAETISARIANVVLPEAGGGEVRLGSLWEKKPAVLVFLRHYG